MDFDALLDSMEKKYPELPPRLRKALRFVIQDPTTVALSPLRRSAEIAGVSPTTLIRLASAFDFKTYDEFREQFRESVRLGSQRYTGAASQLMGQRTTSDRTDFFAKGGMVLSELIRSVFADLSPSMIEAAGRCLTSSRTTYILGLRSAHAAAFYFHYVCSTFNASTRLVDPGRGMVSDQVISATSDDTLLAISFDPYPVETVRIVELFAKTGTKIIAITDHRLSPIARNAEHTLLVPASSSSFYTTLIPTMALLESLLSFMLIETGEKGVERIHKRFSRLEELGVFWSDQAKDIT